MKLTGTIKTIRFKGDDGFYILVITSGMVDTVAVGVFPKVAEGEFVVLEGEYINHPKFGSQFKAVKLQKEEPKSKDALIRYLGSGLFKGVGEVSAKRIVEAFGEDSLKVIQERPHLLAKIKGFSKAKATAISEDYNKNKVLQEAVIYLQEKGITINMALKIYKEYEKDTVVIVEKNPYKLIEDIHGIGFLTADRIAFSVGIQKDSPFRVRAAIVHCLKEAVDRNGHTYLTIEEICEAVEKLIGESNKVLSMIEELASFQKVKKVMLPSLDEAIFLKGVYQAEHGSATKLVGLIKNGGATITNKDKNNPVRERSALPHGDTSPVGDRGSAVRSPTDKNSSNVQLPPINPQSPNETETDKLIFDYQTQYSIEFNDEQKTAIKLALTGGVSVITGGPGTGKTTIIKCLLNLFNRNGLECLLLAPTGRAAKRMSESTGENAYTIHRALASNNGGQIGTFSMGKALKYDGKQLDSDVVIIDEMSMVDVFVLYSLLSSIRDGTKIIMLGDSDQLPSVGAGNCLKDILSKVQGVRLEQIYRQAKESRIITNAHLINKGLMPVLDARNGTGDPSAPLRSAQDDKPLMASNAYPNEPTNHQPPTTKNDFFFVKEKFPAKMAALACDLVSVRLPKYLGITPDKIQVLSPMKNGEAGTINLNRLLSQTINKGDKPKLQIGDSVVLKEGDKVMQISNNYNLEWTKDGEIGQGVFNGDMGTIVAVSNEPRQAEVLFEDGRRAIYDSNLDEIILAYAITVHKSQGSEYDAIVITLPMSSPMILTRNLLYTAITRAKKMVVIVGEDWTVKKMVDNDYIAKRNSALGHFIDKATKEYDRLFGSGED